MNDLQEKQLDKVRKLLAKAESSTHPEEARAFTEKAQELITQWSIDEAMLAAGRNAEGVQAETATIVIDYSPYQSPKEILLGTVARANRCQVVLTATVDTKRIKNNRYQKISKATIIGFPSDLRATEVLYTSLLLQAEREFQAPEVQAAMFHETSHPGHRIKWRNAFMLGYAGRIGQRLDEAKRTTEKAAESKTPGTALVLVSRDQLVLAKQAEIFPHLTRKFATAGQGGGSGRGHGAAAADRANVGQTGVGGGARGALR